MVTKEAQPLGLLSEEHEMLRKAAREFAQNEILPIAAEHDESGEFPLDTVRKMGQMGFMGIEVPEIYGGAGMDTLAYVLALEEICKADAAHGTVMSVNNSLFCYGIMKFGSRMDVFLPLTAMVRVKVGDAVRGGETVMAVLHSGHG